MASGEITITIGFDAVSKRILVDGEPQGEPLELEISTEILLALIRYRNDLRFPPALDARERRLATVEHLIAKIIQQGEKSI
jgi:hypothetical protein